MASTEDTPPGNPLMNEPSRRGDERPEDLELRFRILSAEYSALIFHLGSTWSVSAARTNLFFVALSAAGVALALISNASRFSREFQVFALALLLLGILGWLYREPAFYQALRLDGPRIGAVLAGFALIVPVFTFPFQPFASLIARRQEFEADAFAAAHASAADLVSALAKLYRDNASTLTPDPLHSLVYDSHPPAALRIDHLRRTVP